MPEVPTAPMKATVGWPSVRIRTIRCAQSPVAFCLPCQPFLPYAQAMLKRLNFPKGQNDAGKGIRDTERSRTADFSSVSS
jgi:hypothetical protein